MNKLALIVALLLPAQPTTDKPCTTCDGYGTRHGFYRVEFLGMSLRVRLTADCWKCDGYGKERTIYGGLLK
jgi:DnaJ-class molecular chaperone